MSKIPYSSVVGNLMYLMVCTRPDISHVISLVSRYLSNPGKQYWEAVKWVLRYLKGSKDTYVIYKASSVKQGIKGFVDSEYAGDRDKCRSLSGYLFQVFGCTMSWKASLQHVITLSSTEAEYVAITKAVKESMWIQGITEELGITKDVAVINCDIQSGIHLSKNQMLFERTKHLNVRLHLIRDVIDSGVVQVKKINTKDNPANMMTKALFGSSFQRCVELICLGA